jgi:hypothetical protein
VSPMSMTQKSEYFRVPISKKTGPKVKSGILLLGSLFLDIPFGIPIWDPHLGPPFGTPIWDPRFNFCSSPFDRFFPSIATFWLNYLHSLAGSTFCFVVVEHLYFCTKLVNGPNLTSPLHKPHPRHPKIKV